MYKIARYSLVFVLVFSVCISSVPAQAFQGEGMSPPVAGEMSSTDSVAQETAVLSPSAIVLSDTVQQPAPSIQQPTIEPLSVVEQVEVTPIAPTISVDGSPIAPTSALLVTGFGISSDRNIVFLQLTNTDDQPFSLANMTVELLYADLETEAPCTVALEGYLLPKKHLLLAPEGTSLAPQAHEGVIRHFQCPTLPGYALENIMLYQYEAPIEDIRLSYFTMPTASAYTWMRKGVTASSRTGEAKDFIPFNSTVHRLYGSDVYVPPEEIALEIIEVLIAPQPCVSGDVRLECYSYVKLYNPSNVPIDLTQYRLRGGEINKSATSSNTSLLQGVVDPHSFIVIAHDRANERLSLNTTAGTVWFQDAYGLKNYPSAVMPYTGASNTGNQGKSWAYDSTRQIWAWGQPSPETLANRFIEEVPHIAVAAAQGLKPCGENQYRSTETNRCRTIASPAVLLPCREGQYRNEATNRCRNIALAGGTLTPCKDTQYRSEETNRCRNLVMAASALVPCKDNQYRSEETNRCRTMASAAIPAAAFAIEPIADASTAFIGWWALGGLGLVALAYGVWEWRRELTIGIRRMATFFTIHK